VLAFVREMESYDERAQVTAAPGRLELVRNFLNTRDLEHQIDVLETSRETRRWLVTHELLRRNAQVGERDRKRLIELREALRALAFSHNGFRLAPDELARLNRQAANASIAAVFSGSDEVQLIRGKGKGDADDAASALLAIVCDSIHEGSWSRLKACRNVETCGWAFYDQSRNRVGTWCSMSVCGNRAKTRAYRNRQRTAT
jgi:predicted RNA-binding Zn ribbon-like protein